MPDMRLTPWRSLWNRAASCGPVLLLGAVLSLGCALGLPCGGHAATFSLPKAGLHLDPSTLGPEASGLLTDYLHGDRAEALRKIDLFRRLKPQDTDLMLVAGYVHLNSDPAIALDLAAQALARIGRSRTALDLLSAAFARHRALAPDDATDAEIRAVEIESYTRLIARDPDWPELLFRSASQRIALERLRPEDFDQLAKAEAELRHLIAILPPESPAATRAQAQFQLGRALKHMEDSRPTPRRENAPDLPPHYADAVQAFQRTAEINPNRLDAVGEEVLVYLAVGKIDAALSAVDAAFAHFPHPAFQAKLFEMRGDLLRQMGESDAAIAALRQAVEADPTRDGAALTLVQMLYMNGQAEEGAALLDRTVATRPDLLEAHRMVAQATRRTDPDRARAAYTALLDVPPHRAITLGMRPSPERYRTGLYHDAALSLAELHIAAGDRRSAAAAVRLAREFGSETERSRDLTRQLEALPKP